MKESSQSVRDFVLLLHSSEWSAASGRIEARAANGYHSLGNGVRERMVSEGGGGELARFYTRSQIGRLLIETMTGNSPRSLLDLGAGAGVLSRAAMEQWGDTEYVTVDIDASASGPLHDQFKIIAPGVHVHHVHDVLDVDLPDRILQGRTFDASISNPPYLRPLWKPEFEQILERAGLSDAIISKSDVSADVLFIAQSVRTTARGGTIGLIIPDGIITGRQYSDLRSALFQQHSLRTVVQLPRGSFHGTEAQAFILVFRNRVPGTGSVALQRLTADGELSDKLFVDLQAAKRRLDYEFHNAGLGQRGGTTLESLAASVRRGSINATAARRSGTSVFHTSDFCTATGGRLVLPEPVGASSTAIVAGPGDILLARVDRSLHSKVAYVEKGGMALSDCVYRIRCQPDDAEMVFRAMHSAQGARLLAAASRGIGARLLSKSELLGISFDLGR